MPTPPNFYTRGISYPQRNFESVFSTVLEMKEQIETIGGANNKGIGRAALYEELSTVDTRIGTILAALEAWLDEVDVRLADIETRLDGIDAAIADLDARVTALEP